MREGLGGSVREGGSRGGAGAREQGEGGCGGYLWLCAANVAHCEAHRPPDRGVSTKAFAHRPLFAVEAYASTYRSVDNDHRRCPHRRRPHTVRVEYWVAGDGVKLENCL
jgi:hypothetical protein